MSSDAPASRVTEGDLCSDQEFAKTLLAQAAGRASPAFLQRIHDVCARTLQCRIKAHRQSSEQGKRDREREHRKRECGRAALLDRKEVGREFWHERNYLPRDCCAYDAGKQAYQHALESKKP